MQGVRPRPPPGGWDDRHPEPPRSWRWKKQRLGAGVDEDELLQPEKRSGGPLDGARLYAGDRLAFIIVGDDVTAVGSGEIVYRVYGTNAPIALLTAREQSIAFWVRGNTLQPLDPTQPPLRVVRR
jgi:hypothetical protein